MLGNNFATYMIIIFSVAAFSMEENIPVYTNTPESLNKYISVHHYYKFYNELSRLSGAERVAFLAQTHRFEELRDLAHVDFFVQSAEISVGIIGYVAYPYATTNEEKDYGLTAYVKKCRNVPCYKENCENPCCDDKRPNAEMQKFISSLTKPADFLNFN